MTQRKIQEEATPQENSFYRNYYQYVIYVLMVVIVLFAAAVCVVLYQMFHRPLPEFQALMPTTGQRMKLTPFEEPNLLPDTIIQWASKAAVLAYTFDFYNYKDQQAAARPFFTEGGWADYLSEVGEVVGDVVKNKLIVNSVVAGTPVISNQGDLPDRGYTWRVQIPFLVTYQSANAAPTRAFYVIVTIVRVPTYINPTGIGIDQFVMMNRGGA